MALNSSYVEDFVLNTATFEGAALEKGCFLGALISSVKHVGS